MPSSYFLLLQARERVWFYYYKVIIIYTSVIAQSFFIISAELWKLLLLSQRFVRCCSRRHQAMHLNFFLNVLCYVISCARKQREYWINNENPKRSACQFIKITSFDHRWLFKIYFGSTIFVLKIDFSFKLIVVSDWVSFYS